MSYLIQNDLLSQLSPDQLLQALGFASVIVDHDVGQTVLSQEHTLRAITGGVELAEADPEVFNDYLRSSRLLVRELRLKSGDQALIVNGRVSRIIPSHVSLISMSDDRL
jgi:UDP-glucose:glycoprotein glucosyltransferase